MPGRQVKSKLAISESTGQDPARREGIRKPHQANLGMRRFVSFFDISRLKPQRDCRVAQRQRHVYVKVNFIELRTT